MKDCLTARRLAKYKALATKWIGPHPNPHFVAGELATWQYHAKQAVKGRKNIGCWQRLEDMACHASSSDRAYYIDSFDWFREVGDANDVASLRHEGWYCDSFQDNLAIGVVLQLPGKDGKARYIPAIRFTGMDGVTVYPLDWYEEKEDAARAADHYAERFAEDAREDDAKDHAEQRIEEAKDEIVANRLERRKLIAEMRAARVMIAPFPNSFATLCAAIRGKLANLKEESASAHALIEKLTDNYWESVA